MQDRKVLIVDDEKDFVSTLAERLRLRGIHADEASSGEEALRMIAANAPQVVVLDIMMPGMSGLDVLKVIKSRYPHVEVILLTGLGTKKEGIELGAADCLIKPLQVEELIEKINKAVQKEG
ncbi:MAG: response regulator [Desulfomonilaceae bacterium]